ncbi:hypothetical protein [Paenibacillus sp. Soil522]|uniref:hypothetical protein n=1 Tax=Paenibacillus sp. Soil522 TaxID=1736388 RepID=UPI0006FC1292|nr:hypothetical protein [Paenibacillus sp. Soil522]KRE47883.1 hypothetical protein ASG81_08195 [Paenibacillus sp. Soil522]
MSWLITLSIFWIIGGIFYFSLFVVSKRADKMAEAIFVREFMESKAASSIIINEIHYSDEETIGKLCLSS